MLIKVKNLIIDTEQITAVVELKDSTAGKSIVHVQSASGTQYHVGPTKLYCDATVAEFAEVLGLDESVPEEKS